MSTIEAFAAGLICGTFLMTGAIIIGGIETNQHQEIHMRMKAVPLPVKCAPYYNDGTDSWINCMGVGYK